MTAALALSLTLVAPALAETFNHTDARHDVKRYPQSHRAPHNRQSDATHLRIVHDATAVRFYVRFRRAGTQGIDFRTFRVPIKTPGDSYTAVFIRNHDGSQQDDLFDETTGRSIVCKQTSVRDRHTIWLRIDRSCLGDPRWVRAAMTTGTVLGTNDSRGDNPLSDDWRQADGDGPFSPRVHAPL